MIKVKICGITNSEDALFASKQGADALGFIFSQKSPRYISEKEAKKIITALDPLVTKVGVFVDEDKEKVFDLAYSLNLDVLQFHGKENAAYCRFFRPKFKVIKVFFPHDMPFKKKISQYAVDAYLFDVRQEEKDNGVKILSESALQEIKGLIKEGFRVIVSGGLNTKNLSKIIRLKPYAVDVASGVEKGPRKKDEEFVSLFIQKVKNEIT